MATEKEKVDNKKVLNHHSRSNSFSKRNSRLSSDRKLSEPINGIILDKKDIALCKSAPPRKRLTTNKFSSSKFSSKENNHTGPRYTFSTDIPEKYDDFYLCALPRDPQWVYVYWEFPDGSHGCTKGNPEQQFGQWILRVKTDHKQPATKETEFDVPINIKETNWYVKLPEPGCKYNIQCGQITNNGDFIPVSSTNALSTPTAVMKSADTSTPNALSSMVDSYNNNPAIKYIAQFHDRAKSIPQNRSSQKSENHSDTNHSTDTKHQYLGSAAIN